MKWKRRKSKDHRARPKGTDRLTLVGSLFFIFVFFIFFRLFQLQILNHNVYVALASGQHELVKKLFPQRGEIFSIDLAEPGKRYAIAANREMDFVFADPRNVKNAEETAKKLSPILNIPEQELVKRFSNPNDRYEPLKHRLTETESSDIRSLNLEGIQLLKESWRFYPEGETLGHLTGFVGYSEDKLKGQIGIEGYFEKELAGTEGFLQSERGAGGQWITIGNMELKEAEDGDTIVTTIDRNLQFFACQQLKKSVEKHGAEKGIVIIMDPKTGSIRSMCNEPSFDPNRYSEEEDMSVFNNVALFDQYEPGSVFKSFAIAKALEEGKITPHTIHDDTGSVQIGKYTIRNSDGKSHGKVDFTTVLEESLNTGSIAAVRMIGEKSWRDTVKDFGFGEKTGIELLAESKGDVSPLDSLKEIYAATSSFGQGITVTAIQLITAYGAIANGGYLLKPTIIQEIQKPNGFTNKIEPTIIRQVISSKTSTMLSSMLVNVVDYGHAKRAAVSGYYIAGKTGTGQIPRGDGLGYEEHLHKDTFVGFGPVENPTFVILTYIDRPKDVQWAEGSAVPLFGEIAKFIFHYYQIPPTRSYENIEKNY